MRRTFILGAVYRRRRKAHGSSACGRKSVSDLGISLPNLGPVLSSDPALLSSGIWGVADLSEHRVPRFAIHSSAPKSVAQRKGSSKSKTRSRDGERRNAMHVTPRKDLQRPKGRNVRNGGYITPVYATHMGKQFKIYNLSRGAIVATNHAGAGGRPWGAAVQSVTRSRHQTRARRRTAPQAPGR